MAGRRSVFDDSGLNLPDTFTMAPGARVGLRAMPAATRFTLRHAPQAAQYQANVAGFDLSQPINALRETAGESRHALLSARLGPDEWLLIREDAGAGSAELAGLIAAGLGDGHALVDVSHRNCAIELTGPGAADLLNTGCPLDLDDAAFPVGTATRTLYAKAEIVLLRRGNIDLGPHYRIECWRSFGRYLAQHLIEAAELTGLAGPA